MQKQLIFVLAGILLSVAAFGQKNVSQTESLSLKLYQAKDWEKLVEVAEEALDNGISFYYLHYRLGIAYYELKKYRKALPHFHRVYQRDSSDIIIQEYLYYSYVFSGREADAWLFTKSMDGQLKNKLDIPDNKALIFSQISINHAELTDKSMASVSHIRSKIPDDEMGYQYITTAYTSTSATMSHQLFPRLSATYKITGLFKDNFYTTRDYLSLNQQANGFFTDPEESVEQTQYYLDLSYLIARGLTLTAAMHYVETEFELDGIDAIGPANSERTKDYIKSSGGIYFLGIKKEAGNFTVGLGGSYGNLDKGEQLQQELSVEWYPLSNLDLYTVSIISHQSRQGQTNHSSWTAYQKAGVSMFKQLFWLEIFAMKGDIRNFALHQAAVLYNPGDMITGEYGINFMLPLFEEKTMFSLSYSLNTYKSWFRDFGGTKVAEPVTYSHFLLNTSIRWNF